MEHNKIINALFLTESDRPGVLILSLTPKLSLYPFFLPSPPLYHPIPLPINPIPHTAILSHCHTAVLSYYHTVLLMYCY